MRLAREFDLARDVAGCPVCRGPLTITSDVITGTTRSSCPTCLARAERARRRELYTEQAIAFVAARYSLTPHELDRRLRRGRLKPAAGPRTIHLVCPVCAVARTVQRQKNNVVMCKRCRWRHLMGLPPRTVGQQRYYQPKTCPHHGSWQPTGPRSRCPGCRTTPQAPIARERSSQVPPRGSREVAA